MNVRYLHSDIGAIERVEILRELRQGEFAVSSGSIWLREGRFLSVAVAILDADKEGFCVRNKSGSDGWPRLGT